MNTKHEPQTVGKSGLRPCFTPRLAVRARAMAKASAGRKGTRWPDVIQPGVGTLYFCHFYKVKILPGTK